MPAQWSRPAAFIQLRVCQEVRTQLRADEFDQFVACAHTLSVTQCVRRDR
jgi:hypothetical protein